MGDQPCDETSKVEIESADPKDPGNSLEEILHKITNRIATSEERVWFARWLGLHDPELVVEATIWAIGDNSLRPGLIRTPRRVVKSWKELYAGYGKKARDVFTKDSDGSFDCERYDQMIILRNIPFSSTCEHHLLSFSGKANVAYIPSEKAAGLIGISKLARLVEIHSCRLQNQERITQNVVNDLMSITGAHGAAVRLMASHNCMACRGVKKPGSEMVTTALLGAFRRDGVKSEFFAAIQR